MNGESMRREDLLRPSLDHLGHEASPVCVGADLVDPSERSRFERGRERQRREHPDVLVEHLVVDLWRPALELGGLGDDRVTLGVLRLGRQLVQPLGEVPPERETVGQGEPGWSGRRRSPRIARVPDCPWHCSLT
jgi:hypothetical protein